MAACEAVVVKMKREIASERVLSPYNQTLPVILTCDASPMDVVGVLSQIIDRQERPIAFASRSLTAAE
jgi:hypothetical protein